MVANSNNSQSKGKQNTRKTAKPITPVEAAQILASALSYCNQAGLTVTGYNDGTSLKLSIEGVNYEGDQINVTCL